MPVVPAPSRPCDALLIVSVGLLWSALHFKLAARSLAADREIAREAAAREAAGAAAKEGIA